MILRPVDVAFIAFCDVLYDYTDHVLYTLIYSLYSLVTYHREYRNTYQFLIPPNPPHSEILPRMQVLDGFYT